MQGQVELSHNRTHFYWSLPIITYFVLTVSSYCSDIVSPCETPRSFSSLVQIEIVFYHELSVIKKKQRKTKLIIRMEFVVEKWRAHTFWAAYAKMEEKKFFIPPEALQEEEDDEESGSFGRNGFLGGYIGCDISRWCRRFYHRLVPLHFRTEPITLVRRLMYWIRRSYYRVKDDDQMDATSFQMLYIEKAKVIGVLLLLFNLTSLVMMMLYFNGRIVPLGTSTAWMSFRAAGSHYTAEWILINTLCLICLVPFLIFPADSRSKWTLFNIPFVDVWATLGYVILVIRFLRSVISLTRGHLEGEQCYGLEELYPDKEFWFRFILYQVIQDIVQVSVLCVLPFVWPWSLIFCIQIAVDCILRGLTCNDIGDISPTAKRKIYVSYYMTILAYCFVSVAMVTLHFQRSIRGSGYHVEEQKHVAQETKEVVELLCSGMMVQLEDGKKVLDEMDEFSSHIPEFSSLTRDIKLARESMLSEVDIILLLATLGEGRFQVSPEHKVEVEQILVRAVLDVRSKIKLMDHDLHVNMVSTKMEVTTDRRCLCLLTYFGLLSLYYYRTEIIQKVKDRSFSSTLQAFVDYSLQEIDEAAAARKKNIADEGKRQCNLVVKLVFTTAAMDELLNIDSALTSEEASERSRTTQYPEPFQSICVVCVKLAQACGGDFNVFSDHVIITLPVFAQEAEAGPLATGVHGADKATHSSVNLLTDIGSGRMYYGSGYDAVDSETAAMMRDYVCAYLSDSNLEGLFLNALDKVPGGYQTKVHHHLNAVDLKVRTIVIVQSLQALEEVRECQFTGKVVLFTERMSYLDHQERAQFDFVLRLPSRGNDLAEFVAFVRQEMKQMTLGATTRRESAFSDVHSVLTSLTQSQGVGTIEDFRQNAVAVIRAVLTFVPAIAQERLEDYVKWRFSNPAGDLHHHSVHIEVFGAGMFMFHIALVTQSVSSTIYFIIATISGIILLQRRSIYGLLDRYMSHTTFWYVHSGFATVLTVFALMVLFVIRVDGSSRAREYSNVNDFLLSESTESLGFSGLQILFFVLIFPNVVSYFTLWMPFSHALINSLCAVARCYFHILKDFAAFLDLDMLVLILTIFTTILVLLGSTLIRNESISRHSFLQMHDLTMGRAYLESCLTLVRHMNPSLQRLLSAQQKIMDLLLKAGLSRNILLQRSLVSLAQDLQGCLVLGRHLSLDMAMIDEASFFGEYKTDVLDSMRASLLLPVITAACAPYAAKLAAHSIHIRVRIAPEALVVRIDSKVVTAVISKLCDRAFKRIYNAISTARNAANSGDKRPALISHQILLHVEPDLPPPDKVYRFTDVRRLRILMLDSAPQPGEETANGWVEFENSQRQLGQFSKLSADRSPRSLAAAQLMQATMRTQKNQELYSPRDIHSPPGQQSPSRGCAKVIFDHILAATSQECAPSMGQWLPAMEDFTPLQQTGIRFRRCRFVREPLTEKHVRYFGFEDEDRLAVERRRQQHQQSKRTSPDVVPVLGDNSSRCRYEEGAAVHRYYKSYQSVVVPFLLCSDAEKYRQYLKKSMLNRLWRVETLSRYFYPRYYRLNAPFVSYSRGGEAPTPTSSRSREDNMSNSGSSGGSGGSGGNNSGGWKEAKPRQRSSSRHNGRHHHHHGHHHSHSHHHGHHHGSHHPQAGYGDHMDGSSSSMSSSSGDRNAGSNVAIFVAQHGDLRHFYRDLHFTFAVQQSGRCRLHELNNRVVHSFSMPDVSLYNGEEIIVIEYAPQGGGIGVHDNLPLLLRKSAKKKRIAAVPWTQAMMDMEYDPVRVLVHYLRLHGFVGVVVVVGPPLLEGEDHIKDTLPPQEWSEFNSLLGEDDPNHVWEAPHLPSRDAVWADAYIGLPLTPPKMKYIVSLKERRMVEVVLSIK